MVAEFQQDVIQVIENRATTKKVNGKGEENARVNTQI